MASGDRSIPWRYSCPCAGGKRFLGNRGAATSQREQNKPEHAEDLHKIFTSHRFFVIGDVASDEDLQ